MVADLEAQGLLVKVEEHVHNVGTHDRCGTTVEPMVKQQWFVKMDELIKPAVEAVKNGDIQLLPKRMEKTYFNWTDNIRDWCISRQLWWGHRIPAYYCPDCGEMVVAKSAPQKCPKCGCGHMEQDPGHPHDFLGLRADGKSAVPHGTVPRTGARFPGTQDEQIARQWYRSA